MKIYQFPQWLVRHFYEFVLKQNSLITQMSVHYDPKTKEIGITGGSSHIIPAHKYQIGYYSVKDFIKKLQNGVET